VVEKRRSIATRSAGTKAAIAAAQMTVA